MRHEGLATESRVARKGARFPAAVPAEASAAVPAVSHPSADEVLVKKRALKQVKQQVSALFHGEDLPEGALTREVAEVPYQVPAVPREANDCPVYQQSFKTHHRLMVHMGVHRGEKFPCDKYGKVLANSKMLRRHIRACVQGHKVSCPDCGKEYASSQGMKQHHKAKHGVVLLRWMRVFHVLIVRKCTRSRKVCWNTGRFVLITLIGRVLSIAGYLGVPPQATPFSWMKNLNSHLSNVHGWAERWA